MVALALFTAILAGTMPLNVQCPDTVAVGQRFSLTIRCVSTSCTGLYAGTPSTGPGLAFNGTSTSSSVSIVNTPQGTTRQSQYTLTMNFTAVSPGDWTIGPIAVNAAGAGSHTVPARTVTVTGTGGVPSPVQQPVQSRRYAWIQPAIRGNTRGRVYPGVPVTVDYYLYSTYNATNITYAWQGSDRGVITGVDEQNEIVWEHSEVPGVNRARFITLLFVPACPGVLPLPTVSATVTYTGMATLVTAPKDYLQSDSATVDVYPFPEPVPDGWDGTLLDSVSLSLERRGFAVGQAGEQTVRLTAAGPGAGYLKDPGFVTLHGNARLLESARGAEDGHAWWDFIVEPAATGTVVLGPDTLTWLDRKHGRYGMTVLEPCTLSIALIPRENREITVPDPGDGGLPVTTWILLSLGALVVMSTVLILAGGRRRNHRESVAGAEDLEELLNRFEGEICVILKGKPEYMGCEELADLLDSMETGTLLSRSIQRFWKDMEQHISGREPGREAFLALRETAVRLLGELAEEMARKRS